MNISLKYKLFFAILSAHVMVYVAMYSIGKGQFNQGFIDYLSRIEEQQVPALVEGLEDYYDFTGSWENIRGNHPLWNVLIRNSIESAAIRNAETIAEIRGVSPSRPLPPAPRPLPENDWYYASEYSPARPHLLLLDANQDIIFGDPDALPLANLTPIMIDDRTVGYLAVTSRQELEDQADILFAETQEQSFFVFAVVLVIISGLIAFPFSSYLVLPIKDMVAGTRALTSGVYTSRLKKRGSDELGQLSEDFNTLAKTLEQNQTARRQWIADISHELRTPLAIMRGELEAVQDGIRPLNPETVESLHSEVVHLNTLVNDLHELSMSDLGALVYKKERINLTMVLEKTIEKYQQLIQQHDIHITTRFQPLHGDEDIHMFGDDGRMKQLFGNLLQNTCRYTDDGGELHIHVNELSDKLLIEWYDSAPGVRDHELEHIFERLYRVEASRGRRGGGSGLGLTICRNIVEAHEGSIYADHSELGGLRLNIELPKRLSS